MGLGNPGPRFQLTRHNAGYHVVDILMQQPPVAFHRRFFSPYFHYIFPGSDEIPPLILVRYKGYMNRSGEVVPALKKHLDFKKENFFVILDNMDLEPGICRLKRGGGDAGHNGLKSLIQHIGDGDFHRIYIGIGRPDTGKSVVDHVLGEPEGDSSAAIVKACFRAAAAVREMPGKPLERITEELNRRERD